MYGVVCTRKACLSRRRYSRCGTQPHNGLDATLFSYDGTSTASSFLSFDKKLSLCDEMKAISRYDLYLNLTLLLVSCHLKLCHTLLQHSTSNSFRKKKYDRASGSLQSPIQRCLLFKKKNQYRYTPLSATNETGKKDSGNNDKKWKCGDVYKDLNRLETAINLSNAEVNLQHIERMETLEYFAKQRRPLYPDLRKFVLLPLGGATVIYAFSRYSKTKQLARLVTTCLDYYFWTFVVMVPIIMLIAKKLSMPPPPTVPEELEILDPDYLRFIDTDWEDPKTSCQDHILFLLEHWTSSVSGIALVGCLIRILKLPEHCIIRIWMSYAQALTRIGAVASLHQYPKQLYKLRRAQQPKPLGLFQSLLQPLVQRMFSLAPLGFASDLSKIFMYYQWDSLFALYGTISLVLLGTSVRLANSDPKLKEPPIGTKVVYAMATTAIWRKQLLRFVQSGSKFPFERLVSKLRRSPLKLTLASFGGLCVGLTPLICPIINILAITSIFRIVYTHDLSLSIDVEEFKNMLNDEAMKKERMKWRYRLEWREPKRVPHLLAEWNDNLVYWWVAKGSVTEQVAEELRDGRKNSEIEGKRVWERVEQNMKPGEFTDRDMWKTNAMQRLAEKHQADYDAKRYEDPLGVAVQQALGIGLGFNFDHMRDLEEGEKSSLCRLQARAAKSAIKRVRELYDPARLRREVDAISDPKERKEKLKESRRRTKEEIDFLAKRLSELIPTGPCQEFDEKTRVQQFKQTQSFKRTSSHEYTMKQPVEADLGMYDVQIPDVQSPSDETSDDDEFIEAFIEQQKKREADDDDTTMMLA